MTSPGTPIFFKTATFGRGSLIPVVFGSLGVPSQVQLATPDPTPTSLASVGRIARAVVATSFFPEMAKGEFGKDGGPQNPTWAPYIMGNPEL